MNTACPNPIVQSMLFIINVLDLAINLNNIANLNLSQGITSGMAWIQKEGLELLAAKMCGDKEKNPNTATRNAKHLE